MRTVTVTASSRLHFGLLSFGDAQRRQFGGVGVMVARPQVKLEVSGSDRLQCEGSQSARVRQFAWLWAAHHDKRDALACRLVLHSAPPPHVGLGSGTQVALAVAAGLQRYFELPDLLPSQLALTVGRGQRSAVGTYGFALGGLLAEHGKLAHEPLAPLALRVSLPDQWRFVLVRDRDATGLSGLAEREAFSGLPPVPPAVTRELVVELHERLIPAARAADWEAFGASLYDYGVLAGNCFAACQGGPFASSRIAELISAIRRFGIAGVGQSSWGPTVFAIAWDQQQAEALCAYLQEHDKFRAALCEITSADDVGARIVVAESRS